MDIPLLNRKQMPGLLEVSFEYGLEDVVNDLSGFDTSDFTSINVERSNDFINYPLSHRDVYDRFFKGDEEGSLASDLYVQYTFTKQQGDANISQQLLSDSGKTVRSRLRRLQKNSLHYIPEADDSRYTELAEHCPNSVRRLVDTITSYGDDVTRVRLAGLAPGHKVKLHRDHDPTKLIRLHVPIITNDKCLVECEDKKNELHRVHMHRGSSYILNTGRRHGVVNESTSWRVHLLIDIRGQSFISKSKTAIVID